MLQYNDGTQVSLLLPPVASSAPCYDNPAVYIPIFCTLSNVVATCLNLDTQSAFSLLLVLKKIKLMWQSVVVRAVIRVPFSYTCCANMYTAVSISDTNRSFYGKNRR